MYTLRMSVINKEATHFLKIGITLIEENYNF